ncbi:MAG TPA: helix-turn-helix transcriptional regulator [Solirubrobacterales bacterium]|nr:helix-turn-helix transcriptional regulator [Solirubrobacterales bacterium]
MRAENQLKAGDARAALSFAAAVAECADEAQLTARFESLAGLIGADGVIVVGGRDWMAETAVEVRDPGVYPAGLLEALAHCWRDHPVMVPDLAVADRRARRLSDHVAPREWLRRDLFNDFYRPLGMLHELSAQLAWGPAGSSCCIALHRAGRDFGGRELELLELLAPHLRAARARIAAESRSVGPAASLDEGWAAAALARRLPITAREAEVLAHLAAGRTNRGIAEELGISRHTVVRHVEHLYAKLGVHTRAAATRVALVTLLDDA